MSSKSKQVTYQPGDVATLLYHRKGRTYRLQVVVEQVIARGVRLGGPLYLVRSPGGGEVTTSGAELRPGNILDRIASALEDSDG